MTASRYISIPKVPRNLSQHDIYRILEKLRTNQQRFIDQGIPQAVFNRQYGQIISSTAGDTGVPNAAASPDAARPKPVKNLSITEGYTTLTLEWFTVNNNWTHFQIFRSETSMWEDSILIGSAITEAFTDAPPEADTTYYYWVRPVNGVTLGALTGPVSGMVENVGLGDGLPPAEPQNIRAVGNIRTVHVQWSASVSNDVIFYEVYRDTTEWATDQEVLDNATSLGKTGATYWVDDLDAGDSTTYYYWVRSLDVEDLLSSFDTSPTQRGAAAITADTIDITPEATTYIESDTDAVLDLPSNDTYAASTAQVETADPCDGQWALIFVNATCLHFGGGNNNRFCTMRLKEENLTDVTDSYEGAGTWRVEDDVAQSYPVSWVFLRPLNPTKQYRWTPEFKYDVVFTGGGNEEMVNIEVLSMVVKR